MSKMPGLIHNLKLTSARDAVSAGKLHGFEALQKKRNERREPEVDHPIENWHKPQQLGKRMLRIDPSIGLQGGCKLRRIGLRRQAAHHQSTSGHVNTV